MGWVAGEYLADAYAIPVNTAQAEMSQLTGGQTVTHARLGISGATMSQSLAQQANVNYTNWYAYHTILEAVRNYDTWPSANKNGTYYFEPLYGASNSFVRVRLGQEIEERHVVAGPAGGA